MVLLCALLGASTAFAEPTPVAAPALTVEASESSAGAFPEEILYVPPGSSLSLGKIKYKTSGKTWLFPEEHYKTAIVKAQNLAICEPALSKLRGDYSSLLMANEQEVSACSSLLGEAHKREEELTSRALLLESQNTGLQVKLSAARKASIVSWAVTGALLLGAGTAVYFTAQ